EVRQAFARWAVAAMTRYRGRGILWEMWNEPNLFWTPKVNAEDYVKLALTTGEAVKRALPDECFIGPAGAWMDFPFLEKVFAGGTLRYFDAISVHPYRDSAPDTVAPDYEKLRSLIQKYAPQGKEIPILAGEWGYSSSTTKLTEEQQARYLARQWLTNLASGIPLSIWYDWRDDGDDPKQSEHRYGLVKRAHFPNRTPAFDPKPAYVAAQNLIRELRGFQFEKRLPTGSPNDHVLQFRRGNDLKIAAWTSEPAKVVSLSLSGNFTAADVLGKTQPPIAAQNGALSLSLSPAVLYLTAQNAPTGPVAAPANPRHAPKPTVLAFPFGALFIEGQAPKLTLQLPENDASSRAVSLQMTVFDLENRTVHTFTTKRALRGSQSATIELPRFAPGRYRVAATANWGEKSLAMTHHFGVVSRDLASRPSSQIPRWVGVNSYIQHMDAQIYPPAFELMNLLGVRHVRWLPGWGNIQPEENRYDWKNSDAFIALCKQNGITVMACLSYWGAPWTHQKSQELGGAPMGFSAPARQLWADSFAAPTMKRYGDYVKEWQIWNEPNAFWDDDPAQGRGFARAFGSPANYYDLFSKTYDAGHKLNKNLRIMTTLAGTNERDLRRLFDFGLAQKFDGFIGHTYGNHAGRLKMARELLREKGHGDKPLGSGEIGLPADPGDANAQRRQAQFVAEVFLSTVPLPNISGVDWFVLSNRVAEGTYGLLDNRFEPMPSALAYFTTARLLSGATKGTSQTRGNLRLHQVERKGRAPLLALWTNDGSPRQVSLRLKRGVAKIWDLTGRAVPVSWQKGRAQIQAAQPVFIEGDISLDEPIELEIAPAPGGVRVRVTSEIAGNATLTLQTPSGTQSRPVTLTRGTSEAVFPVQSPPMGRSSEVSAQLQWKNGRTTASRQLDFAVAPRVETAVATELRRPQNHPFWRVEGEENWHGMIPDAYTGPEDLSLEIAFGWTPEHLVLWLEARDDIHVFANPTAPWSTDSGQIAFDAGYRRSPDAPFVEYAFGLGEKGSIAFAPDAPHYSANLSAQREGDKTFYRLLVPWSDLAVTPRAGMPIGASLIVNDNDGPRRQGWLGWGSGIGLSKNPALYRDLVLGEALTTP
ncbi:MAG: beta-galactosidase, partial [Armatimonadetes bacterium]|nr:beta-galactosidase [Armatimonadota bacterium]